MFCLAGYLLLTAPIDDDNYGFLRGIFLLLTHLLPYALWFHVFILIKPNIRIRDIHWLIKLLAITYFAWFTYFFAYQQGGGAFHQFNHIMGIAICAHIVFLSSFSLNDDLVQSRRQKRVFIALAFGIYSSILAIFEIVDYSVRDDPLFSIFNSAIILCLIFGFSFFVAKTKKTIANASAESSLENSEANEIIPVSFKSDLIKLNAMMGDKYFTQSKLTITVLAKDLSMPEHRLRLLINKYLGFQNFSTYLNSYRILEAQKILADESQMNTPIITIALNLGYGSLGPFNRAFKHVNKLTPSEYRKSFQNRR